MRKLRLINEALRGIQELAFTMEEGDFDANRVECFCAAIKALTVQAGIECDRALEPLGGFPRGWAADPDDAAREAAVRG